MDFELNEMEKFAIVGSILRGAAKAGAGIVSGISRGAAGASGIAARSAMALPGQAVKHIGNPARMLLGEFPAFFGFTALGKGIESLRPKYRARFRGAPSFSFKVSNPSEWMPKKSSLDLIMIIKDARRHIDESR